MAQKRTRAKPRKSAGLAVVAALALLSGCAAAPQKPAAPIGCVLDPPASIGGPLALTGGSGAPVTQAAFLGKPTILYFGFANCPDICPISLSALGLAYQELGPASAELQSALISLDPARDTPDVLSRYVASAGFPPGLKGLSGTPEATAEAAKAFKVGWRRSEMPDSGLGYVIDHTSYFYLMDADWRLKALFPSDLSPADAAACIGAATGLGEGRPESK